MHACIRKSLVDALAHTGFFSMFIHEKESLQEIYTTKKYLNMVLTRKKKMKKK